MTMVEDSLAEIIKEDVSVLGSSLTECKNDQQNGGGPDSSVNKDNEDCDGGTEEKISPSSDVDSSHMTNDQLYTRYFVIKSLNLDNIQLSVEKGIWATQVMNEPVLEEAFHNSDRVILIFSVNMSGFFQGYAQMMSSVSWKRDNVWSKLSGGSNPWGRTFKVKWLRLCDLPFQKTLHLKNPLNDYKPVKISRDCQELSAGIGEALCRLFDGEVDSKGKSKRTNSVMDEGLLKRPCKISTTHFGDEDGLLPEPSLHMRWAESTMLNSSLLYQHAQHEVNIHQPVLGRLPRFSCHQSSYSYADSENAVCMKQSFPRQSLNKRPGCRNEFSVSASDDLSHGVNVAISLTEEDFLSMTYEEYLEAIGSSSFSSRCLPSASVGTTSDRARVQSNRE